jgi:hypothetical protein
MNCEVCGRALRGGIAVLEGQHPNGKQIVHIVADPDRNWIECEGCSRVICHNCSQHPKTGLCDGCLEQSKAFEELQFVENCPLDELEEFLQTKRNQQ